MEFSMGNADVFLGVDGGGTKTIGLLTDRAGGQIARHVTGATNPNVVGIETSGARLVEVTNACCAAARCDPKAIRGAVFGLAGAGREENRHGLLQALHSVYTTAFPAKIETDARIALEGAFSGAPGIVVIAGTGSVIVAKEPAGEVFLVGGWGRSLGDDGSGYFLGIELERAFARLVDGLTDSPVLRRGLSERLGWTTRVHLVASVYRDKLEPSTLAPLVLDLAAQGEPESLDILRRGAAALTAQILSARSRFTSPVVRVATIGGLIDKPTVYRGILAETLERSGAGIDMCMPDRTAVEGAVMMARATWGGGEQRTEGGKQ
jgi:N-acetylglucosamine kinase-like BadF-type ATPase